MTSSATKVVSATSEKSTPTSDTTPAFGQGRELEVALRLMSDGANGFAQSIIKDPTARAEYGRKAAAARDEIIQLVKDRRITPHEGAISANAIRNQIMELSRSRLSDFGLAISKDMKSSGKPLDMLQSRKAEELFQKPFEALNANEKNSVWVQIVHSAGKSNAAVNRFATAYGVAGRVFLVASLAYAVYEVASSDDRPRQAAKEGASFAGGVAGGVSAGAIATFVASNPAGWAVGVLIFVGAACGAIGSSSVFDYYWPEKRF